MVPNKQTFWDIKKDFIKQNNTTCYSWDPLDDKSEEDFQKVSEYLITICDFMKPVLVEKYFDGGHRPQTITCLLPIVNRTMQLDEQDFTLLTDIRHLYVPKCLISIILMIIYLNCALQFHQKLSTVMLRVSWVWSQMQETESSMLRVF